MAMNTSYNHHEQEKRWRLWWADENIYAPNLQAPRLVTIDTPPPTVSGSLHIGHIFSYTQTDIVARFLRMNGAEVWYPFGFDDNGLPTERFVEKKRGIVAHRMGRSEFIQVCLDETAPVEEAFKDLWQRMGLSVDWRYCYSTIDARSRHISQLSFLRLYEKGHVYRRDEPSLYCTTCCTTVAQAELDDAEQKSTFYDIAFTALDGTALIVATTRPELLPACVAVFYHPDDVRYQHLKNTTLRVPLFNYEVPVLPDDQVIPGKGTGLVMCCTFGDTNDIVWYKKHQLPYRPAIGSDGRWLPSTGILAGKKVANAREAVVEALREAGLLLSSREIQHAVNVHERCKQGIEFLVIQQWFLKLLPFKQEFLACADKINWYPAFMKTRYQNWVENLTWDWCLSRQRFFGIPFPVWHCMSCQEVLLPQESDLPVDPQETSWQGSCTQCGGTDIAPDRDVMDTWNTSSLTPYICASMRGVKPEDVFDVPFEPMAIRPQAHDIIRTWAFDTIVKVWMHHGTIPWNDIVISGHVLSGSGDKLSKSKQNSALEPDVLLTNHSADAIRYWTASGSLGQDVAFSEQQIKLGNRLLVKLWNAFRFIGEHGCIDASLVNADVAPTQTVHRWMATRLHDCYKQYDVYFKSYEFSLALGVLERCFWHDFCDNYLEIIKDQFFNPDAYAPYVVAEARMMLARCGVQLLQLFAPCMPYVTETVYDALYRTAMNNASIHKTLFSELQLTVHDEHALTAMELVLRVIAAVRRSKTEAKLSLRTDLASLTICGSEAHKTILVAEDALIRGATRSKTVVCIVEEKPSWLEERDGVWHMGISL